VIAQQIRAHLRSFDLPRLFIEDLGWDRAQLFPLSVDLGFGHFELRAVAQKRGFVAYVCDVDDGALPSRAERWRIEREVAKNSFEHLIIYVDMARTTQVWEWVRRDGARRRVRSHTYRQSGTGEALAQKLEALAFSLEEEDRVSILDATSRVRKAFDTDRVTKRFYERFKQLHTAFLSFITGITSQGDREWYASVMLNRLMFVYFIQKKHFLDNDPHYLRTRLERTRRERGPDAFYSFYRHFLLRLFHDGLGHPEPRTTELDELLGRVPYLNGGLFDVHDLEAKNPDIDVADAAFEQVLDFFDAYEWHLDDRPLRADNEINPDVLGYIFEKYINQRELGAYYTKDDITEYIVEKTVMPVILGRLLRSIPSASATLADLLKLDPVGYTPPSMSTGADIDLPDQVKAGIENPQLRGNWNVLADPGIANANETWRDVVRRRETLRENRRLLASGVLPTVEELVSLNVDLQQLIVDLVARCTTAAEVETILETVAQATVLDHACGSGAFLFSALQQLERLYSACVDRLEELATDAPSGTSMLPDQAGEGSERLSTRLLAASNRRHAILKTVMLRNLFGVDILEEAVEICKLRLFLKLVAQIEPGEALEPLPDVDFNIRPGNSLVGFDTRSSIRGAHQVRADLEGTMGELDRQIERIDSLTARFRTSQESTTNTSFAGLKKELRHSLDMLRAALDEETARAQGIPPTGAAYEDWRTAYQPFHWFLEFHETLNAGGFDAVVGNPPYIELKNLSRYKLLGYRTESAGNLYAMMIERSMALVNATGRQGFIVPVSSVSTDRYSELQELLTERDLHFSSYDDRPSRLFDGLEHVRLTIHLIGGAAPQPRIMSTRYHKWTAEERAALFQVIRYQAPGKPLLPGSIAKLSAEIEMGIVEKLRSRRRRLAMYYSKIGSSQVYYTRKVGYFLQILNFVPVLLDATGKQRPPSELKEIRFPSQAYADLALACLSSNLFYWFVTVFSDCRNLNRREIDGFPVAIDELAESDACSVLRADTSELMAELQDKSEMRQMRFGGETLTIQHIFPRRSKRLIDRIDRSLGDHYGFTPDELDFILNYEIKYRLGLDEVLD
jgi:hypothetical protein